MKKMLFVLIAVFSSYVLFAQLKTTTVCPQIAVDLLDGKVNGLNISSTIGQIKAVLPCPTSTVAENDSAKCGGGIFYKDKDLYFYTARNYVEIGPAFKGKLSVPLMGAARTGLFKTLGHPKIKDVSWDAFTTNYGIMILYYNKAGKVNKIQISSENDQTINLCQ